MLMTFARNQEIATAAVGEGGIILWLFIFMIFLLLL